MKPSAATLTILAGLAMGCSDGSAPSSVDNSEFDADNSSADIHTLASVTLDRVRADRTQIDASFFQVRDALPAQTVPATEGTIQDDCDVSVSHLTDPVFRPADSASPYDNTASAAQALDVGDYVELVANGQIVTRLIRNTSLESVGYAMDTLWLEGELPAELRLRPSNDQDQPWADITLRPVQPLVLLSPDVATELAMDTRFEWVAGSDTEAFISIETYAHLDDQRLLRLRCSAVDDGDFQWPETALQAVRAQIPSLTRFDHVQIHRTATQTVNSGNHLTTLTSFSGP